MRMIFYIYYLIFLLTIFGCANKNHKIEENNIQTNTNINVQNSKTVLDTVKYLKYELIRTFPHDVNAYTQGLFYKDGFLYESTGQYGSSSIRKVDYANGQVLFKKDLPRHYFGEGITYFKNKIYFLTWYEETCFVLDPETFETVDIKNYKNEGWGITNDGEFLIMSDGSNFLRIIGPENFEIINSIPVFYKNRPLRYLNELVYVNGLVFANVWQSDNIYVINLETGELKYIIDFSNLREYVLHNSFAEVFNGIAYNPETDTFIVTGKNWNYYFEVKILFE